MGNEHFRALQTRKTENGYKTEVVEKPFSDLPEGELLVRINYSSLNYKDALSASGNKGVTKKYPHTPGIDAAGVVEKSGSGEFSEGEEVIAIGYDLGMNTSGGLSEYISIPAGWAVKKPAALSLRTAMCYGTAGFTAAMLVDRLLQAGVEPDQGPVLVTGASGGVGLFACWLLSQLGFEVQALSRKADQTDWFRSLGVSEVVNHEVLESYASKPMVKPIWSAAIDCLGGEPLANLLKAIKYDGVVAICGLAASPQLPTSVFPFILRGISLFGIDSAEFPIRERKRIWQRIADEWQFAGWDQLQNQVIDELRLQEVPEALKNFASGKHLGRYIVNLTS